MVPGALFRGSGECCDTACDLPAALVVAKSHRAFAWPADEAGTLTLIDSTIAINSAYPEDYFDPPTLAGVAQGARLCGSGLLGSLTLTIASKGDPAMKSETLIAALAIALSAPVAMAQETPKSMVRTYDAMADAILSLKRAEASFVRALLDEYRRGAEAAMKRGDREAAAAEIALFANEGDNAIGGIRKRLVEGGHHHHAQAETEGIYEPGYVIVTKEAKRELLAASVALRRAESEAAQQEAWQQFTALATDLLRVE